MCLHWATLTFSYFKRLGMRENSDYHFKYILLIMLLQLPHIFSPLFPSALHPPSHQHSPAPRTCPWVIHISSLASPFPILFSTSPCLFFTYNLCFLFPVPFPPFSPYPFPADNGPLISISVILFLF